jgi:hypothetical protein
VSEPNEVDLKLFYDKVTTKGDEFKTAQAKYEKSKGETARYRKNMDEIGADLTKLITSSKEEYPLWKEGKTPIKEVDPADNAWRETKLETLELSEHQLKCLSDGSITTLGELTDFQAKRPLTDLEGVGPGFITKLEEATTKFWQSYEPPKAEKAEPGPELEQPESASAEPVAAA